MYELEWEGKSIRGGFKREGDFMVCETGRIRISIPIDEWDELPKRKV